MKKVALLIGVASISACVIDARDRNLELFDIPKTLEVDVAPDLLCLT